MAVKVLDSASTPIACVPKFRASPDADLILELGLAQGARVFDAQRPGLHLQFIARGAVEPGEFDGFKFVHSRHARHFCSPVNPSSTKRGRRPGWVPGTALVSPTSLARPDLELIDPTEEVQTSE